MRCAIMRARTVVCLSIDCRHGVSRVSVCLRRLRSLSQHSLHLHRNRGSLGELQSDEI